MEANREIITLVVILLEPEPEVGVEHHKPVL
jgi:hypothetical protein